jgi:hypothetical protein
MNCFWQTCNIGFELYVKYGRVYIESIRIKIKFTVSYFICISLAVSEIIMRTNRHYSFMLYTSCKEKDAFFVTGETGLSAEVIIVRFEGESSLSQKLYSFQVHKCIIIIYPQLNICWKLRTWFSGQICSSSSSRETDSWATGPPLQWVTGDLLRWQDEYSVKLTPT